MHVGLLTNESEADVAAPQTCEEPHHCRRGATAMEYLVMASFVLVVLIISVQQLGLTTGKLMDKNATATKLDKNTPKQK